MIDLHRLIKTKYLPAVQSWVQVGTDSDAKLVISHHISQAASCVTAASCCSDGTTTLQRVSGCSWCQRIISCLCRGSGGSCGCPTLSVRSASVQVFTKGGAEQQVKRAVDLKRCLEAALQKHNELHIDYKTRVRRVVSVVWISHTETRGHGVHAAGPAAHR